MIKRRPRDATRVISMCDPALYGLPMDVLFQYETTRDIALLPENLSETPTIVKCGPLETKWETVARMAEEGDANSLWFIFRTHVLGFENDLSDVSPVLQKSSNVVALPDELRDELPPEFVQDISMYIIQRASKGDLGPFVSQATWQVDHRKRSALDAMNAPLKGTAKSETTN